MAIINVTKNPPNQLYLNKISIIPAFFIVQVVWIRVQQAKKLYLNWIRFQCIAAKIKCTCCLCGAVRSGFERGRESILYRYSWNFNCTRPTPLTGTEEIYVMHHVKYTNQGLSNDGIIFRPLQSGRTVPLNETSVYTGNKIL